MGLEGRLISGRLAAAAAGCSVLLSVDVVIIVSLSFVYHNIYALLLLTQVMPIYSDDGNYSKSWNLWFSDSRLSLSWLSAIKLLHVTIGDPRVQLQDIVTSRVMWREERKRSCESTPLELHSSSFEYPASSRRYTRRRYDSIDCSIRLTWWRGILFNLQLLRLPFVGRHGGHMYISTRQLHIVEDLNQLARTQLYLYSYVFSYYYFTSSK